MSVGVPAPMVTEEKKVDPLNAETSGWEMRIRENLFLLCPGKGISKDVHEIDSKLPRPLSAKFEIKSWFRKKEDS